MNSRECYKYRTCVRLLLCIGQRFPKCGEANCLCEEHLFPTKCGHKINYIFWYAYCLVQIWCLLYSLTLISQKFIYLGKVCNSLTDFMYNLLIWIYSGGVGREVLTGAQAIKVRERLVCAIQWHFLSWLSFEYRAKSEDECHWLNGMDVRGNCSDLF
jgi:hypothetical protein